MKYLKTITTAMMLAPYVAFAQARLQNPVTINSLPEFLVALLRVIITISVPVIVVMVIYSGYTFVSANGKPEEINKAKRMILWTLVGALIILGAELVKDVVANTIGDIRP